ncbi:hypothetical protein C1O66_16270 [Paucibacter aquatile]|uniref:Uncharacterized protein n=2 Tax=Kinneretia aquatilis TaxID=2070761 RepID=A0A2N8KZP1_9BURK|nr:hypothetical protein C1O66_16270 [Paucibacter aquatile]
MASYAADSCALQAAQQLSQGQFNELAAMFAEPKDKVSLARALEDLARPLGSVQEVIPQPRQTAGLSTRQSVAPTALQTSAPFEASWALAITQGGARYELQASSQPGSSCTLLALHVSRLVGE